jgi:hypothetical protein
MWGLCPRFVVKVIGRKTKNETFLVWLLTSKLVLFFSSLLAKFYIRFQFHKSYPTDFPT